jgi:hypothetical protein
MDEHPPLDNGKSGVEWQGVTGPDIEIFTRKGRKVRAQWSSEPLANGATGWAFWHRTGNKCTGTYDALAFRPAQHEMTEQKGT